MVFEELEVNPCPDFALTWEESMKMLITMRIFAIVFIVLVFWVLYEQNYTHPFRLGN